LRNLNVSGNNLQKIPKDIASLKMLEELYISQCNIKEIPSSIGELHSLNYLDIHENNIKNLPNTILNCTNLKRLVLPEKLNYFNKKSRKIIKKLKKQGTTVEWTPKRRHHPER